MNDPYAEGREAHDAGIPETDNPYNLDTNAENHMAWNDGWAAGAEAAEDE